MANAPLSCSSFLILLLTTYGASSGTHSKGMKILKESIKKGSQPCVSRPETEELLVRS